MKRILTSALLVLAGTSHVQEFAERTSIGQVSMSADVFRFAGACWSLMGTFGHEDYFANLRVQKSREETKYLKRGKEVNNFPDQTDITLYLETAPCAHDKESSILTDVSPEQAIESVKFKVAWKRDEYLRPAKINSFHIDKQFAITNQSFPARKVWKAALSVESLGVPLSDHLIVSMMSKDGVRLARISGQVAH